MSVNYVFCVLIILLWMYKNVPVLRKCKQKYLGVKGQYIYNIQSDGSEKSVYIPINRMIKQI